MSYVVESVKQMETQQPSIDMVTGAMYTVVAF